MTPQPSYQTIAIHIFLNISRSKGNQTIKLGYLIEQYFFSIWVLFHKHSQITGLQGNREGITSSLPLRPASQTLRH